MAHDDKISFKRSSTLGTTTKISSFSTRGIPALDAHAVNDVREWFQQCI